MAATLTKKQLLLICLSLVCVCLSSAVALTLPKNPKVDQFCEAYLNGQKYATQPGPSSVIQYQTAFVTNAAVFQTYYTSFGTSTVTLPYRRRRLARQAPHHPHPHPHKKPHRHPHPHAHGHAHPHNPHPHPTSTAESDPDSYLLKLAKAAGLGDIFGNSTQVITTACLEELYGPQTSAGVKTVTDVITQTIQPTQTITSQVPANTKVVRSSLFYLKAVSGTYAGQYFVPTNPTYGNNAYFGSTPYAFELRDNSFIIPGSPTRFFNGYNTAATLWIDGVDEVSNTGSNADRKLFCTLGSAIDQAATRFPVTCAHPLYTTPTFIYRTTANNPNYVYYGTPTSSYVAFDVEAVRVP